MVTQTNRPEYRLDHVTGFEGLVFTESSASPLALPESAAFARERDSVLQSAREAWAFRIDSAGTLDSNDYQSTRTAALCLTRDDRPCIAICDSSNPDENILLARPQEGYGAHVASGTWLLPRTDPHIRRMLERAQDERRVFPASVEGLSLSTLHVGSVSQYGSHPVVGAILGADLAQLVATSLCDHHARTGYVRALSYYDLRSLDVDDDNVEVRCVGVGKVNLYADVLCSSRDGLARGVREHSSGNKG